MRKEIRKAIAEAKPARHYRTRLTPGERKMTLQAIAALDTARPGRSSTGEKREEADRPDREADLIAEAIRRRNERLEILRRAFSGIIAPN